MNEGMLPSKRTRGSTTDSPVDRHLGGASRTAGLYLPRYTHEDLDRMVDEIANRKSSAGTKTPYPATFVVAASEARNEVKAVADYVCDGVSDEVEINAALSQSTVAKRVLLSEGYFYTKAAIVMNAWDSLYGMGPYETGIITQTPWTGATTAIFGGSAAGNLSVGDMYVETGSEDCIDLAKGTNARIERVRMQVNTSGYGFFCGGSPSGIQILNCDIYSPSSGGIRLSSASGNHSAGLIAGNLIRGSKYGIVLDGTGAVAETYRGFVIANNMIEDPLREGILLAGVSESNVTGNVVLLNTAGSATHNTYDGIKLDANCDRNVVTANRVTRRTPIAAYFRYGINVAAASCNRNLVRGNHLYQSGATASYNDAGTLTNVVDANDNYV